MFVLKIVPETLNRCRIDIALVELKIAKTRQNAQALILSGKVFINDLKITKAGSFVKTNSVIKVKKSNEWVSRGGVKLNSALKKCNIFVQNKTCLDIGCSTGGFTQVLLRNYAKKVFAVDVGYGQFDWKLRNCERVKLFEKTNARYLDDKIISEKIDLVVCDVSFISLKKVIKPIYPLLNRKFEILSLIKPQFEAAKNLLGRGGIIKDPELHSQICEDIRTWFVEEFKPKIVNVFDSPIKGQKGNKEFFIYISN